MKFVIFGRLDGLNEYTKECRGNKYGGNKSKQKNQSVVETVIKQTKFKKIENYPVTIKIEWFEPNKRRDIDNITFATKFILDAMVKTKVIIDDSQKYVNEIEHKVLVDKDNPRIEVVIHE